MAHALTKVTAVDHLKLIGPISEEISEYGVQADDVVCVFETLPYATVTES